MAYLRDTIVNGTLTINSGYLNCPNKAGSYLNGFTTSPIVIPDATDTSNYYPWIAQKNTSAAKMFSVGTFQDYFVILGSASSRTTNGYDYGWFFNVTKGELKLNNNYLYLYSNNYTNYAPTKTGSGASGTWGINISGNAASLSSTLAISKGGTGATSFTKDHFLICPSGSNSIKADSDAVNGNLELGYIHNNGNQTQLKIRNYYNCVELIIFSNKNAGVYGDSAYFTDSSSSKPPSGTLFASGKSSWLIYINTSGVVTAKTSDKRKKFYIEDMPENETRVLLNIPIRNFIYKEDIGHNDLEQNGIFAQDLREAIKANSIGNRPWLQWEYNDDDRDDVYYDINAPEKDDMTYSVSYNHMVPALIKGWQMQNKEIEELEKKLAILRIKKINGLSS